MKNWVNLHNHTTFSMLDGHGKVEAYAKRTRELQMGALAITDHGNIHGWIDFYHECKEQDVKPIFGLEAYQARKTRFDRDEEERAGPAQFEWQQRGPYHLTMIAKDKVGYHNLIRISSQSFLEGFYVKPRIDHDLIAEHSEGLIVLSGCLNGEVQQALMRGDFEYALNAASTMQDIVGKENYFIEIQDHGLDEQRRVKEDTLKIAKIIGAPVVCTGDCHYVHKEDAHSHDLMLCTGTGCTVHDEDRFKFFGPEFYLKSYDEMEKTFEPEWLKNTCAIADMVNVDLSFDQLYFPTFPDVPKEKSVDDYLDELAWAGLKERYGDPLPQEVIDRAEHELGVVKRMGFQEYFLVVGDLVQWAKDNDIMVGWGRGSAAGSILSYALRITNLDPLKFGLLFERFLVEGRKSMPDIDLDFDDRYRERVIEYARQKYGEDRVAHIVTFTTVKAKTALRDMARVLGHPYEVGDKLAKLVPPPVLGVTKSLRETMDGVPEFKRLHEEDPVYREVIDAAFGVEGIQRQTGIHAAGVVIAPGPVWDYVPVMRKPTKNQGVDEVPIVTQWDMDRVEQCGMLKIDFLGLRNLGVIDMCVKLVKERYGVDIDVDEIPLDDELVYKSLCEGDSIGVFQLESGGMKDMMLSLQPDVIDDIMALVSLYRPGPMGSGMDQMFVNRKHGREKVTYAHEHLKDVLDVSYGIMLYQEDVLNVARHLAGFDAGEADDLRKAIGKKKMDLIPVFREKFVKGCKETHDVPEHVANKIYSDIEYFAGYGFNRAHAASYAMVSYITSYLRQHYPVEYMAGALSSVAGANNEGAKARTRLYLEGCRRMGLKVNPPSITKSEREFSVDENEELVYGLAGVQGIGPSIIESIFDTKESEFTSTLDFFRKCDSEVLKKNILEHLARSGAFDDIVLEENQTPLDREAKLELLELEKDELGVYITEHPLGEAWSHVEPDISTTISDLKHTSADGQFVHVGGILSKVVKRTTKRGQLMYNLTIEDPTDDIEVLVFPNTAKKIQEDFFNEGDIGILSGKVSQEGDPEHPNYKLFFNKFKKMDDALLHGGPPILLKTSEKLTASQLQRLSDIIDRHTGDSPVILEFPEGGRTVVVQFSKTVDASVRENLETIVSLSERVHAYGT